MPVVHARTLAEAQLYANLSVLLEDTGDVRSGTPEDGREAWTVRFGDIEALVPYASEAAAADAGFRFGVGHSELIDAGQWQLISAEYAHRTLAEDLAFAEQPDDGRYEDIVLGWQIARDAAIEVLKFVPPGQDRVPDEAFWTEVGLIARDREPGRFTRTVLEADIAYYQHNLNDLRKTNT
jgi:hypothetical protein